MDVSNKQHSGNQQNVKNDQSVSAEDKSNRQRKLLVVDDEVEVARTLCRALTRMGYEAALATGGQEALQFLQVNQSKSNPFEVLVTDIHMPELRGDVLQRMARERDPDLAVILITAMDDVGLAVNCLKEGVHDYILKPFDLMDVTVRVAKALEKRDLIIRDRDHTLNLQRRVTEQTERIDRMYRQTLEAMCNALEARDESTRNHSQRVSLLSSRIASHLCPDDPTFIEVVREAALLHDLGKIRIPDSVLNKPGALTEEEWALIQTHPVAGEAILAPLGMNPSILACIRHHHERMDGKGYPDKLSIDAIPLGARIIAVADAFDAMTSPRPYRSGMMAAQAIKDLQGASGTQVDGTVVEALLAVGPPDT